MQNRLDNRECKDSKDNHVFKSSTKVFSMYKLHILDS